MGELRAWIEANALSVSREEVVNPFARSSIEYRRKLVVEPKKDGDEPAQCVVYREAHHREWVRRGATGTRNYNGVTKWTTGMGQHQGKEQRTYAVVRLWKKWHEQRMISAMFLRIGSHGGAWLVGAGREPAKAIARPPDDLVPTETVFVREGGYLRAEERPVAAVAEWNEEVAQARAWIERERDDNRPFVPTMDYLCCQCHKIQADLVAKRSGKGYCRDPWRMIHGAAWCPGCYMEKYDMRRITNG